MHTKEYLGETTHEIKRTFNTFTLTQVFEMLIEFIRVIKKPKNLTIIMVKVFNHRTFNISGHFNNPDVFDINNHVFNKKNNMNF